MLSLLLLAQSTGALGPSLKLVPLIPRRSCRAASDDELVVCGREQQSPYRLKPLSPRFEQPLVPKAKTGVLGGTASIEAEQADIAGAPSRRAMARVKWRF